MITMINLNIGWRKQIREHFQKFEINDSFETIRNKLSTRWKWEVKKKSVEFNKKQRNYPKRTILFKAKNDLYNLLFLY